MIGETISHYRIIEKLGEGGMGVVYKALDTTLDRHVAIKFLPPHLSKDEEATKRFIHEAKAASALDHANIGTIYEVEKTPDGRTFIVMAYYEGETLRERIDQGKISVDEAINIIAQIASGLARAHEKEIVHRDIKPSNIIITERNEAKIIDFGLAKLAGKTRLTKEGTTLGTVAYMSPEQAKGEETDHRSDIFSLGVILYELLAGEPPFKGEHEAALLYEIVHESPKPLTEHRVDLPEAVISIVDRALKKNAVERYQNASDLRREIADYTQRSVLREMKGSGEIRSAGSSRSKIKLWGGIAAAALIIVVMLALIRPALFRDEAVSEELTLAIIDFRDLSNTDNQSISVGLTSFLHIGLDESSPIRVISSDLIYDIRRRLFGSGRGAIEPDQVLEVARKAKSTMFLTGQIIGSADERYVTWRLVETSSGNNFAARQTEGGSLADLADGIIAETLPLIDRESNAEAASTPISVAAMTTKSTQAYQHYIAGILAFGERRTHDAIKEQENAVKYDSTFALAYAALSMAYYSSMGSYSDRDLAIEYAKKAVKLKSRLSLKERQSVEANLARVEGRVGDALVILRELNNKWPDDINVAKTLVEVLFWYGYMDEALDVSRKSIALFPDDPILAAFQGAALSYKGNLAEALEYTKSFAERHPTILNTWDTVAEMFLALGLPDSAEVYYHKVLEKDEGFLFSQAGLGDCEFARGNVANAIAIFEQILQRTDLSSGQRRELLVSSTNNSSLALFYLDAGQYMKSLELFEEARQYVSKPNQEYLLERDRCYFLLKAGRTEEVLSWARTLERRTDITSGQKAIALYYMAKALIALDSIQAARIVASELQTLEEANISTEAYEIEALIALAENTPDEAIEAINQMSKNFIYYKASANYFNQSEIKAHAFRMAGCLEDAAQEHHNLLRVWAGHAISHYMLGQIYEEMNRPDDAKKEYGKFLEMWSEADEGLPQLEDARERLAKLKGT
jgi:serine/threonine protein kinase/predicted Zn-dependent protease